MAELKTSVTEVEAPTDQPNADKNVDEYPEEEVERCVSY